MSFDIKCMYREDCDNLSRLASFTGIAIITLLCQVNIIPCFLLPSTFAERNPFYIETVDIILTVIRVICFAVIVDTFVRLILMVRPPITNTIVGNGYVIQEHKYVQTLIEVREQGMQGEEQKDENASDRTEKHDEQDISKKVQQDELQQENPAEQKQDERTAVSEEKLQQQSQKQEQTGTKRKPKYSFYYCTMYRPYS